ncbi:MAG: hypothetical protein ED557_03070 [Balneola sp.]|nr:MAG: hypothetical protein ED557_03070 [Balneola sp.]
MLVCGAISMIFIAVSSFNFSERRTDQFLSYAQSYDSLLTKPHPYIYKSDSLRLGEFSGEKTLVLFWASWSEKSSDIMAELDVISHGSTKINVVAALVRDATEELEVPSNQYDFHYIDGTVLNNELRVPGIPSYLILDENGKPVNIQVGYKENQLSDQLAPFVDE